jgi:SAM-dependent methyltransferase
VLDAGCGDGWLANLLARNYDAVAGCDISEGLITEAKKRYMDIPFRICDLADGVPFADRTFDAVVLNMVLHDIAKPQQAVQNLHAQLGKEGTLLVSIVNPYYGFPVGIWKRGVLRWLLRRKPNLRVRPYNSFAVTARDFIWNKKIPGIFYPLSETINTILGQGFTLRHMEELRSETDTETFSLRYRLHRYPLILFFAFKKQPE